MAHLYAIAGMAEPEVNERESSRRPTRPLRAAVLNAIAAMHQRYSEPITLPELAAEVFVSPFHFSRVFAKATGITPGRYLTAVRMFEAKRLLLTTSLTVSDVVCGVGYSSVGTFTSRFTRVVGMTPTQYREPEVSDLLVALSATFRRLPEPQAVSAASRQAAQVHPGSGVVNARVELPRSDGPVNVMVGLFADAVPQCTPVAFTGRVSTMSTNIEIRGVPDGNWVLIALAEHACGTPAASFSVATVRRPVAVRADRPVYLPLVMRRPQPTDPPIAITLASRPTPVGGRLAIQRSSAGLAAA